MKLTMRIFTAIAVLLFSSLALSQESETVISPASEAAEGLDLQAVSELFKNASDLEKFERALNDPETGVNNLDLNEDGEVDYIRVLEEAEDDTHILILQAQLGEDEFQDVATIEVEKSEEDYNMQVHGDEEVYGPEYYIVPAVVRIHTWPIIVRIYRPGYHPYRSRFYWGFFPRWWKPYRVVTVPVYKTRVVKYRSGNAFVVTKTGRVRTVTKVHYVPRKSPVFRKRVPARIAPAKNPPAKDTPKPAPSRRVRR